MNDTFVTLEMLKEKYAEKDLLKLFEQLYPEGVELSELMSDENQKRHNQGIFFAKCFEYTGVVKEYYESGEVQIELTCKKGKLDGVCKAYYSDGKIFII